ncbi:hypothetical protein CDAR_424491 [Caerostris darwini]|uniref:Maturase K n=1 Tax=Caerostris darwini TaxID=1538125 RepID=A0AAV4T4D3_9ARAC|nr:hypothetical protein CDAR_424491 [Caerostris darwini]
MVTKLARFQNLIHLLNDFVSLYFHFVGRYKLIPTPYVLQPIYVAYRDETNLHFLLTPLPSRALQRLAITKSVRDCCLPLFTSFQREQSRP